TRWRLGHSRTGRVVPATHRPILDAGRSTTYHSSVPARRRVKAPARVARKLPRRGGWPDATHGNATPHSRSARPHLVSHRCRAGRRAAPPNRAVRSGDSSLFRLSRSRHTACAVRTSRKTAHGLCLPRTDLAPGVANATLPTPKEFRRGRMGRL